MDYIHNNTFTQTKRTALMDQNVEVQWHESQHPPEEEHERV